MHQEKSYIISRCEMIRGASYTTICNVAHICQRSTIITFRRLMQNQFAVMSYILFALLL